MVSSGDETTDLGKDTGSAVSDDYAPGNSAFTGTVNWVQLDIGEDGHDHLITPRTAFVPPWSVGSRPRVPLPGLNAHPQRRMPWGPVRAG